MKRAEKKDTPERSMARTKWLMSSRNKAPAKPVGTDNKFFSKIMTVGYSAASVLSEKNSTLYSLSKMFPILLERYVYLPQQLSTARGAVAIGIMGETLKLTSCRQARKEKGTSSSDSTNWVDAVELAMMGSEWQIPAEASKLKNLSISSPPETLPSILKLPDEQLLLLGNEKHSGGLPLTRKSFFNTKTAATLRRPKLRSVPQEAIQRAKAEPNLLSFTNSIGPLSEEDVVQGPSVHDKSYCGIRDDAPESYWKKLLRGQEKEEIETVEASGTFHVEKKEKVEEARQSNLGQNWKMLRARRPFAKAEQKKRDNGILHSYSPVSVKPAVSRKQPTREARKRKKIVESDSEEDKITPVYNATVSSRRKRRASRTMYPPIPRKITTWKPMDGLELLKKVQMAQNDSEWVMAQYAIELENIQHEQVKAMTIDELPAEHVALTKIPTLKLSEERKKRRKQSTVFDVGDENSYFLVVDPNEIQEVHLDDESLLRQWSPTNEANRKYHASMTVNDKEESNSIEEGRDAGDEPLVESSAGAEQMQVEAVSNIDENVRVTRSVTRKRTFAEIGTTKHKTQIEAEEAIPIAVKRKKLDTIDPVKPVTRYSLRNRKPSVKGGVAPTKAVTAVTAAKAVAAAKAAATSNMAAETTGGMTTRRVTRASKKNETSTGSNSEQRAENENLYKEVLKKSFAKKAVHKEHIRQWAYGNYKCFKRAEDNLLMLELTMSSEKVKCEKCSVEDDVVLCPRSMVLRLKEGRVWQLVRQYAHVGGGSSY